MAVAYITEFAGMGTTSTGVAPIAKYPSIANQTVAIGAEANSSAFNPATRFIRVHVDAICSIDIALNPTATTSMARLAANQTEYFSVFPGHNISVITNT